MADAKIIQLFPPAPLTLTVQERPPLAPAAPPRHDLTIGTIVHVVGHPKGDDKAHVVVRAPRDGRVRLCELMSERWGASKNWRCEMVVVADDDAMNARTRRARKLVTTAEVRRGMRMIPTGRSVEVWEVVGVPLDAVEASHG